MGMKLDKLPNSSLEHHFVLACAYANLERSVRTGEAPRQRAPEHRRERGAPMLGPTTP
ncbi:MAG: hypothetical protein JWQ97_3507 [Phenylobacterium sp.]|nr:hypothetical protein [Phenylobacterium sp.]